VFVVRALCNCSLWFKHPHILEICSYFIAQNVPHAHMDKVSAKWQYISCHWSVKLILDASLTSVRPSMFYSMSTLFVVSQAGWTAKIIQVTATFWIQVPGVQIFLWYCSITTYLSFSMEPENFPNGTLN
jgi:hypothetical protein